MATRAIAVGERLHHLKVFFSNRAVYAQVVRKTDGHVRASTPARAVSPARAPAPPAREPSERSGWLARDRTLTRSSSTPPPVLPPPPAASPQILAAANTQEREMRETLQNRSDRARGGGRGRAR